MNDGTRVIRGPRQAWPLIARTGAAIIAAALALLAAACGGSPSSTGSGGSPNAAGSAHSQSATSQDLAFARCVRSHGVPNYPDPAGGGGIAKETPQQLGVSGSQYQAAMGACLHLLPNGPQTFPPAEVQLLLTGMRKYSQCMRSHGVPNWPDPSTGSSGQPLFAISSHGITRSVRRSPRVQTAMAECQHLIPSVLGPGDPPLE